MTVFQAVVRAFRDLFSVSILGFLVVSFFVALFLWGGFLALWGWKWFAGVAEFVQSNENVQWALNLLGLSSWTWIIKWILWVLLFLSLLPAIFLIHLILVNVLISPYVIRHLTPVHYPKVKVQGSFRGYFWWRFWGVTLLYLLLLLISLPLWMLPGMSIFIPILWIAGFSREVIAYDLLSYLMDKHTARKFFQQHQNGLLACGLLLGVVSYIPVIQWIAPVWGVLLFYHYILGHWASVGEGAKTSDPQWGGNHYPDRPS